MAYRPKFMAPLTHMGPYEPRQNPRTPAYVSTPLSPRFFRSASAAPKPLGCGSASATEPFRGLPSAHGPLDGVNPCNAPSEKGTVGAWRQSRDQHQISEQTQ
jgi:hypothetical protein